MKAFVLSGGGNLGAGQVGTLLALLERGIEPDLLVGTSAGAINAAYLAGDIVALALAHAKIDGLRVVARCSFVASFIERKPEYQDLVA
jgi:predicted acylesterase/phospholipase RssA